LRGWTGTNDAAAPTEKSDPAARLVSRYAGYVRRLWTGSGKASREATGISRLDRLAARVQALAEEDSRQIHRAGEMAGMRRNAAAELHGICASLAAELNRRIPIPVVEVDPDPYDGSTFNEDGVNLIQLNIRGRLLQFEFEATQDLVSTEDFRVPYTLSGSIRCFNQELLLRNTIDEHLMFYCLEKKVRQWRFFDPRTYRSGPLGRDYLTSLLEQLI
jgi:hypothetical protein